MVACLNACLVMSDSVTESKLALLTVNPRDEVLRQGRGFNPGQQTEKMAE